MMHQKAAKYLFLITNAEDSSKEGKHWWSILNIELKKNSFSLTLFWYWRTKKLYNFIITDEKKKKIQKILSRIEKMTRNDDKITWVKVKFSSKACKTLSQMEIVILSYIASDFFHLVQSFGNFLWLNMTFYISGWWKTCKWLKQWLFQICF